MTTSKRYLLDTNILSDLVRNPRGKVRAGIEQAGEGQICTNVIVAAELRFGAARSRSQQLSERIETILSYLPPLALEPGIDRVCADIRLYLEQRGTPIGPNDLFIAAHARQLGLTLVTANEREFTRVPGLAVMNWLN